MFDRNYAAQAIDQLRQKGIQIEPGLTADEVSAAETAIGAELPLELRFLLEAGLPAGEGFPDWRGDSAGVMRRAWEWVRRAFALDIEENQWWLPAWGPRPEDTEEAKRVAFEHLDVAPALIPIYGHRFMTTAPRRPGNPVLSVWQAVDSIYYGFDLADYLHKEFGILRPNWAAKRPPRVPFWGEVFDLLSEGMPSKVRWGAEAHLVLPYGQVPAFVGCLALGTLYAVQLGAIPSDSPIWSLGHPYFRKPVLHRRDVPEAVIDALQTADELSALEALSPEKYSRTLHHLIASLADALREMPEKTWRLQWLDDMSG